MSTLLEKLIGSAALKDNPLKCLCIKLKPGSVTTDKIADKAVTSAKLSDSVKTDLIQAPINAVREDLGAHVSDTTKHITAQERSTWNSKQDALTFDNTPTANSDNPVKSKGIKSAIDAINFNIKNNLSTYDIKVLYNNNGQDVQYANLYSNADGIRFSISASDFITSSVGDISITSHGENGVSLSADNGDATISSSTTTSIIGSEEVSISSDSAINVNADEEVNINAPSVKINGTNINTIKNNAQNALNKINAMYPGQGDGMQVKTPGIYYAYPDISRMPDLIPSSMNHGAFTGYLLLVTHVVEMDIHGGHTYLHQLILDIVTGRKATRIIGYDGSTIDWSTAPNFTEV